MTDLLESIGLLIEDTLLSEGRSYGGGLHKLGPKELANVPLAGQVDLHHRLLGAAYLVY